VATRGDAPVAAGLIVDYAPGVAVREAPGVPTGADAVTVTDLDMGRSIGAGLRTVAFEGLEDAAVAEAAARQLERDPAVISAEPDWIVELDDVAVTEVESSALERATQASATWGIDRIDQREGIDGTYSYGMTGAGVDAYVIDSGLRASHVDFEGRVGTGATFVDDGRGTSDCDGHGTHVAGTLGGSTYGVAKSVTLIPVRVFDCAGKAWTSSVVEALNWVRSHHTGERPAVVNMSLGSKGSSFIDLAVAQAVSDGISVVAAAGNESEDSCLSSPSRVPVAITVNSSRQDDQRSGFSNFGSCSDLFAPGSQIKSAWWTSDIATAVLSGTSMATPHVAGAVARILERLPAASPAQVWDALDALATPMPASSVGVGDPRKLLYVDPDDMPPGAPSDLQVSARPKGLDVTWSSPQGSVPDSYQVEHSADGITWIADQEVTKTSATIPGLDSALAYAVRVRSVTTGPLGGVSAWTVSGYVTPLLKPRVTVPRQVSLATRSRKVNVRWGAPVAGTPVSYEVAMSINGARFTLAAKVLSTGATLTLPRTAKKVLVRVRAIDSIGRGPWSTAVGARISR
jgi:subtilisin family serine protease